MRKIWIWATCGFLALCLVAVFLFSAGDATPTITPKIPGPTPTPSPTEIVLSPNPEWLETHFSEPLVYENLDIFPNIKTDTYQNTTCIVYNNGQICYIPKSCSGYEKSQDGQKAAALTQSGQLWFIDAYGTHFLESEVSDFSLAGDGSYLYFISNNNLYGYDPQTTNIELLYAPTTTISFMVSSPAGGYCAFSESSTQIRVLERKSGTISTIALDTKITSVAAISEDGQWIYGYCPEMGFVRVNATNRTLTQLSPAGDMITKLYFNKNATELYYEYENTLYFCTKQKMPMKVLDMDGAWWQLLLEQQDDVYTREYLYVHDMFFYNDTFAAYPLIYGMHNLYQLEQTENQDFVWELAIENIDWYNEVSVIYKGEKFFSHCRMNAGVPHHIVIPTEFTDNWKDIMDYSYGTLLYLDNENILHGYDLSGREDVFTINFADISTYGITKDGYIYYRTRDGVLNGFSIVSKRLVELAHFPSSSDYTDILLLEKDSGLYLYDSRESTTKLYRISMEASYITYLGEEV